MARQFQPPTFLTQTPTKEQALAEPLAQSIATIPALWREHKLRMMQQNSLLKEQEFKQKEMESRYGTGVPAPEGIEESPEQKLGRMGTEAYKLLSPPQYGAFVMGSDGKPQFMPMPEGFKPAPAVPSPTPIITPEGEQVGTTVGRPTVLPQPKVGAGIKGKQDVQQALDLYETARDGLLSGLEGTKTGFFSGRIPAVTAKQQTAEGAVAAMAPVLKQLFRVAGEGVFTDKDQELLLNMVPTRKDQPEARQAKITNIDNIVKAKLGFGKPESSSSSLPSVGGTFNGAKVLKVRRIE